MQSHVKRSHYWGARGHNNKSVISLLITFPNWFKISSQQLLLLYPDGLEGKPFFYSLFFLPGLHLHSVGAALSRPAACAASTAPSCLLPLYHSVMSLFARGAAARRHLQLLFFSHCDSDCFEWRFHVSCDMKLFPSGVYMSLCISSEQMFCSCREFWSDLWPPGRSLFLFLSFCFLNARPCCNTVGLRRSCWPRLCLTLGNRSLSLSLFILIEVYVWSIFIRSGHVKRF